MIAPVKTSDRSRSEIGRRQLAETLRRTTPSMLPCEAETAGRVLYSAGYRVNDYGHLVATR